ncbi:hypothetical protein RB195_002781 [Necator americanus]|uniref:Uncharacterized protein n=1 Tax=Necator americanus TaxID=51031 RepID=A0ABR1DL27_NECAM
MDLIQYRKQQQNGGFNDSVPVNDKNVENEGRSEIVKSDCHVSTYSIAQELKISQKTVCNHLYEAGPKKKLDVWVPKTTPGRTHL